MTSTASAPAARQRLKEFSQEAEEQFGKALAGYSSYLEAASIHFAGSLDIVSKAHIDKAQNALLPQDRSPLPDWFKQFGIFFLGLAVAQLGRIASTDGPAPHSSWFWLLGLAAPALILLGLAFGWDALTQYLDSRPPWWIRRRSTTRPAH